jgi:DNA-binding IclR family transcriptional regulator
MFFPKLCDRSVDVLDAIANGGIVSGADLVRKLGYKPEELLHPTKTLLDHKLIEVSGERRADTIVFASFGVLPSVRAYADEVIRQHRQAQQPLASCLCRDGKCRA